MVVKNQLNNIIKLDNNSMFASHKMASKIISRCIRVDFFLGDKPPRPPLEMLAYVLTTPPFLKLWIRPCQFLFYGALVISYLIK